MLFMYPAAGRCPECGVPYSGIWVYILLHPPPRPDIFILIHVHPHSDLGLRRLCARPGMLQHLPLYQAVSAISAVA